MNSHAYTPELKIYHSALVMTILTTLSNEESFDSTPDLIYAYLSNKAFVTTPPLDTD